MTASDVFDGGSRVAIVTGAARRWGLGYAAACALGRRGYDLVVVDNREDWGSESALRIAEETGRKAMFVNTDVSQRSQVSMMVERVLSEFGRIDALVNDAAIMSTASTEDFTDELFSKVIGVNLLGPMLCTQAVIPAMKERHYGRIVNLASTAPYLPPPISTGAVSLYNASKGGLIAWTKAAATELAEYGIVVNVVAVGGISTAMGQEEAPSAETDEYQFNVMHRGMLPWGRVLKVEETAEILAFIADAPNHALLGATIHANGGRVMPL